MEIRKCQSTDIEAITRIYNQGIKDRIDTLEEKERPLLIWKGGLENAENDMRY